MAGHGELPNRRRVLYEPFILDPRDLSTSPEAYADVPQTADSRGRTLIDLVSDQIARASSRPCNEGKDWGRIRAALKRCAPFMDFCIYDFDDDEVFAKWQTEVFLPHVKTWFEGERTLGRRTAHDYVELFCKWMRRHHVNIDAIEDMERWNQCRLWDKSLAGIAPSPKDKKNTQFTDDDVLKIVTRLDSLLNDADSEPLVHESDVTKKGTPKKAGATTVQMLRTAVALSLNMTPRPSETKELCINDITQKEVRRLIRKPTSGTYGKFIGEQIWPETRNAIKEYLATKRNAKSSDRLFPKGAVLEKWFRSLLKDLNIYRGGWMNLHRFRTYDLSTIANRGGTAAHLMASGGFSNLSSVSTYIDENSRAKHIIEANQMKREAFEEVGILEAISTTKQIVDNATYTQVKRERTVETALGIVRESMEYHRIDWAGPKVDLVSGLDGKPTLVPQETGPGVQISLSALSNPTFLNRESVERRFGPSMCCTIPNKTAAHAPVRISLSAPTLLKEQSWLGFVAKPLTRRQTNFVRWLGFERNRYTTLVRNRRH